MSNIFIIIFTDKWQAIRSIKAISERERQKLAAALLDYGCADIQPTGLSNISQGMFDAIKSSLFARNPGGQIGNKNAAKKKNECETNNKTNTANECKNDCEKTNKNELYKLQTTNYILQTTEEKKDKEKPAKAAPVSKFIKPTEEQVQALITQRGYHFTAEEYMDHYNSNGWKVGNAPMKDWQAACGTFERNWKKWNPNVETEAEPEVKKKDTPKVTQCPECGSYDLRITLDRVMCSSCGAFFDYDHSKGKWVRA